MLAVLSTDGETAAEGLRAVDGVLVGALLVSVGFVARELLKCRKGKTGLDHEETPLMPNGV